MLDATIERIRAAHANRTPLILQGGGSKPGGALGADGDRAGEPDGLHQLSDWRGERELEIGLPPGHGEPSRLAGQPDRYRGAGSHAHRGNRPRLIRPLGRLSATGDLDQERLL